ncbi:Profilin [Meloidogyne graminicola]|uniref:Profilin n=1 Tax=Meloidogyne graminicola TaxID=189291 RepID=A0A8T0A0F4_9BILA|nr:Profilin [Meloidogyne graminicola]
MSGWAAYIKTLTDSCSAICRAAIVGLNDGGSVWARTEGEKEFKATEAELKKFVSFFDDISSVPTSGADLEGIHYIVPRTEDNLIFGKKDKTGFFAAKTKSAVLIAIYEGEAAAGADVRGAIESLGDFLEKAGY